jgi:hypothetical protein
MSIDTKEKYKQQENLNTLKYEPSDTLQPHSEGNMQFPDSMTYPLSQKQPSIVEVILFRHNSSAV